MKKLNDYKIKKEIEIKETINNFIEQIPKLTYLLNRFKDECYGNKINKYELEKKIEITEEMKKMGYEELQNKLETIYDQIEEVQRKIEEDNKERNEILKGITIGIDTNDKINYLPKRLIVIEMN